MKLLSPYLLSPLTLPNGMVMASLTRSRHPDTAPNALAPTYHAQRASAGLLIAEATQETPRGVGYPDKPVTHNDAQVVAWRPDFIRLVPQRFPCTVIANGDFDGINGELYGQDGRADLIAYGCPFIANPDLAIR
ncbi:MAG: hypothetical protein AAF624_16020 [Bacteroidota bacterium]